MTAKVENNVIREKVSEVTKLINTKDHQAKYEDVIDLSECCNSITLIFKLDIINSWDVLTLSRIDNYEGFSLHNTTSGMKLHIRFKV